MKTRLLAGNKGISLVELSLIMAIVGILSAVSVPNLVRTLPDRRVKADAMDISSNLRYAKFYAVKSGRNAGVYFNDTAVEHDGVGPDAYCVYLDNDEAGTQGQFDGSDEILVKSIPLRSGVTFESLTCPNNTILFSPNGSASSSAGSVVITNGSLSKTIQVNAVSGIVRVS